MNQIDELMKEVEKGLDCSFCGKSHNEVKKLIAGHDFYICNEWVELFNSYAMEKLNAMDLG